MMAETQSPVRQHQVIALETPRYDPRTRALIEGPIAATLIRLAAPNVLVMLAQTSVGLVETYFVGKLGTDALPDADDVGWRHGRRYVVRNRARSAAAGAPMPMHWRCTRLLSASSSV